MEKYGDKNHMQWFRLPADHELNRYPDGFLCNPPRDLAELLENYMEKDPRRASAEINGIVSIQELYYLEPHSTEVYLVKTRTCNSSLAAETIRKYLVSKGFKTYIGEIRSVEDPEDFEEGLISLLDTVVPRIIDAKRNGVTVYINASPGFKPESTFLVISSVLAGADSIVYIHEAFRQPVILPTPPIILDPETIGILRKVFGDTDEVDTGVLHQYLGRQELELLRNRGVVEVREKTRIRKWFRRLVEIMSDEASSRHA